MEELPPGAVEGPMIMEGPEEYYEEHDEHGHLLHSDPSCSTCGGMGCPTCWLGGRGLLDGLYVRAEFLRWRTSGMAVPALVTSSVATAGTTFPPPVTQAGVLGQPGTVILYGNESLFNDERSGGRLTAGLPLDREYRLTLEGEYFSLDDATDSFSASSSGNPILARPFFNMMTQPSNIPAQSSELVAYPNVIRGTVTVDAESSFQGAAVRGRYLLCCTEACVPGLWQRNYQVPGGYRMELTAGYRFLRLDDSLVIGEDLATIPAPGGFVLQDSFETQNEFHGIEVGMLLQTRRGRWTFDVLSRVAVGNSAGTVSINGSTIIDNGTTAVTHQGALLAQTSNIGTYSQDVLAVAPELGLTIGFDLTPRWRALVGYTFIYWSQVLRAGQQIDLDVNPNLIPPAVSPLVGPLRPGFTPVYSDFWAQGLTIGIEGQW